MNDCRIQASTNNIIVLFDQWKNARIKQWPDSSSPSKRLQLLYEAGWLAGWLAACFLGFLTLQILWVVPAVITLNKTHLETFSHCLCDPAPPRWSSGSWTCPSPQVQSPRYTCVLSQHCGRGSLINRLGNGSNYKLGEHSWCYPTVHRDAFPLTFWLKELLIFPVIVGLQWFSNDISTARLTHSPFWTFCSNVSSFMQILQKWPCLPINCKEKQIKT